MFPNPRSTLAAAFLAWTLAVPEGAASSAEADRYIRERVYDTAVHQDEALVNVQVAMSRCPDCTTLESAIRDIFRIEGVSRKSDQAKRYIPDAVAAIGDPSVVPQLVAPLPRCRFDYRFHIAHALGVLGGPEAEAALEDLARHDPLPAVRHEARRALAARRNQ